MARTIGEVADDIGLDALENVESTPKTSDSKARIDLDSVTVDWRGEMSTSTNKVGEFGLSNEKTIESSTKIFGKRISQFEEICTSILKQLSVA